MKLERENDNEVDDDMHEDMNGFHNLFGKGIGGAQQHYKDPSGGDYKDGSDDKKLRR